ncbi:MAG: AhpC/TSA family protein [Flavobacteriales bacterium]|nr:AhpC/TSA family protein [Flavobacteriales bacterium]
MRAFQLFCLLTIIAFSVGCESEADYTVRGTFSSANGESMYLEKASTQGFQTVRTAVLDDSGEFSFKFPVESIGYYRIRIGQTHQIILIIDKEDNITVNGDLKTISKDYKIEGSKNSILYKEFVMAFQKNLATTDSIKQAHNVIMQTTRDANQIMSLQKRFNEHAQNQLEQSKKFIDDNINEFVILSVIESLDPKKNMDYFKKVEESARANFPNSPIAQDFINKIANLNRVAVGSTPPEIKMTDPMGNIISLSSLKGKVVLVDFWASWCRPCRMESPNLVRLYNEYKPKGLEIYSVSLDKNKDSWIRAIQQDQLNWIHVSELAAWNTSVVKTYGFTGIPFMVLLDREGKIIAKNLRGAQLAQKLSEVLS